MVFYKKVMSDTRPKPLVIDEYSVWVNTNIIKKEMVFGELTAEVFEFDQTQYTKDEYIGLMDEKKDALEAQLTDTQLALCEIYEGMI